VFYGVGRAKMGLQTKPQPVKASGIARMTALIPGGAPRAAKQADKQE